MDQGKSFKQERDHKKYDIAKLQHYCKNPSRLPPRPRLGTREAYRLEICPCRIEKVYSIM